MSFRRHVMAIVALFVMWGSLFPCEGIASEDD